MIKTGRQRAARVFLFTRFAPSRNFSPCCSFIIRRLLQTIPVFIGIILICFALLKFSGDPTNLIASPRASENERQLIRERLGIDKPWYVQLSRYFRADLGRSYRHDRPVTAMVMEGAAVTGRLASER